jgi:hypothetical protein
VHPAGWPVRHPEEAASVLFAAADITRPEVLALLLDDERRGLACVVVGGDRPVPLDEAVELLAEVARRATVVAAVALATVSPTEPAPPSVGDGCQLAEFHSRLGTVGVELLDWFVIGPGVARSVAEECGAPWRWLAPEPAW